MKSKIVTQLVMVEQSKASEIKLKGVKILQRAFLGWKPHFKNHCMNILILPLHAIQEVIKTINRKLENIFHVWLQPIPF